MNRSVPVGRRALLQTALAAGAGAALHAAAPQTPPIIDTHMHVWSNDPRRFPFAHPYDKEFVAPPHEATVEMLLEDMERHQCTHAVLVQVIYHGWDNTYVADCAKRFPGRLKAHGLIDPTDERAAEKLEHWTKEHGLHGMRFSPIYYQDGRHGGDGWLDDKPAHRLWEKAAELESVLNFFIGPRQLPRLGAMLRAHPTTRVIIDHLSQVDLGAANPEPDFRQLLRLARFPNVWVKVSELSSVSKSGRYPFADAYPYVKRVYEAYGPDRLLFGTGYPGAARGHYQRPSLAEEIALIRGMPFFSSSDIAQVLGGNAAQLWKFAV